MVLKAINVRDPYIHIYIYPYIYRRYFTQFAYNFLEKLQKIDTSRLKHSKDNRLNCVAEWFSCSRSHQNVLRKCRKVKTFFKSTKFL